MRSVLKTLSIRYRYFFFFLLSTGLSAFAYLSNLVYFQTNDDFAQMLITSGVLYGSPSSELLYVGKPLRILIAQFYIISQNFSWYTILLLATQSLALYGYLILIDDARFINNKSLRILVVLILVAPILIFLIMFFALQFTQTSIMSTGIGALLVLFGKNIYSKLLGAGLLLIGFLWRAEGGLIAIFIVLGFYFLSLLLERDKTRIKDNSKNILIILSLVFISYLVFLSGFHEKSPFISQEKRVAVSYYKSLGKVLAYEPTKLTRGNLQKNAKKVGWSKNDFRLLNDRFYFANKEVYTEDRNLRLADLTKPKSKIRFYLRVAENLNSILLENHRTTLGFIFLLTSVIFLTFKKSKLYQLIFYLAAIYGVFLFILTLGRLPDRVLWSISFTILTSIGYILFQHDKGKVSLDKETSSPLILKSNVIILGLTYVFIFTNLYNDYLRVDREMWWKYAKQKEILGFERVLTFETDKPIVAFSSFYSALAKTYSPTKSPAQADDIWKNTITFGWTVRSPQGDNRIKQLGLSEDLVTSIVLGEVYLATGDSMTEIDLLNRYFKQHRYIKVNWAAKPFIYNESGLGIWKVDSFEPIPLVKEILN
jgi:hypothetical protein